MLSPLPQASFRSAFSLAHYGQDFANVRTFLCHRRLKVSELRTVIADKPGTDKPGTDGTFTAI
jgi:hypothetical protein